MLRFLYQAMLHQTPLVKILICDLSNAHNCFTFFDIAEVHLKQLLIEVNIPGIANDILIIIELTAKTCSNHDSINSKILYS